MYEFSDTINTLHKHHFKAEGFKKKNMNFLRNRGKTIQLVNFQKSNGGNAVYVNVKVTFEEFCNHFNVDFPDRITNTHGDKIGITWRLENLVNDAPKKWPITLTESQFDSLDCFIGEILRGLNDIETVEEFKQHRWFNISTPSSYRLLAYYLTGQMEKASEELTSLFELFSDRGIDRKKLMERYNLFGLEN